jgi:outer membrane protein OmpA-like peptidoglycan-associated protein
MKTKGSTIIAGMLIAVMVAGLSGCATTGDHAKTKKGAGIGAAVGAITGAIIGHQADRSGGALKGALIGAAAGGALGAGVGAYQDKQQAEFERQLAAEQAAHHVEIERMQNEVLKLTMSSEVSFDYDSAKIKPSFQPTMNKMATIMERYDQTKIVVVGHTDSDGSERYNQRLSEERAVSAAHYLENKNISRTRVGVEGRGELEPRESNATADGRAANRRVEIYVVPDNDASLPPQ